MSKKRTFLIAALMVLAAGPALARGPSPRLAIAEVRGPAAERILGAVESGLMARYSLVPGFSVEQAAREHGVRLDADSDFGVVGRTLEVTGFVSARVQKRGSWQVRLEVRRGDTGVPIGSFVVTDRRLDRLESEVTRQTPGQVRKLLARAAPRARAAAAGPQAAVEPPRLGAAGTDADTTPVIAAAPERTASNEPAIELSVDGRVFTRSFSYVQNVSGLPDYKLDRAMAAAVDLTVYPGALLGRSLPLGLTGAFEYAPGVRSRVAGTEQRIETRVNSYRVGLKYRLSWASASLTPQVTYGSHAFQTSDQNAAAPDVSYQVLGVGAEGRWAPTSGIAFFGSAAYLHGLSVGELADATRFPRATAGGGVFELGAAVPLARALEVRLSMGLRRFGLAMHARPGDELVAGGAVDQSTWLGLGLAYRPTVSR